ncbi:mediator of RNA polymerase II transcription subunit 9 [Tupaia chinensis]|nr:mediator of RNA polymerase II transcription subunit 9 [Tupaia chinensis]
MAEELRSTLSTSMSFPRDLPPKAPGNISAAAFPGPASWPQCPSVKLEVRGSWHSSESWQSPGTHKLGLKIPEVSKLGLKELSQSSARPPRPRPPVAAPQPQQSPAPRPQSPAGVKEEESYSFLPLVHNIIKCMDKDSPEVHQDLSALKTKFQEMRKLISTMPGIHLSPEQQQQQLHSLREQVRTKNELLQKYKSLCMFEIPKE